MDSMNSPDIAVIRRLIDMRTRLLGEYPFFGRLLLRVRFGTAPCGTAYTDMKNIVFDPEFAQRLSDEELRFVMLHELYHCVLKHCTRGRGLDSYLYNVACDIVVNSCILETLNLSEITVDGCEMMHKAPDGFEGRSYSAEQIYYMLLNRRRTLPPMPPPPFEGAPDPDSSDSASGASSKNENSSCDKLSPHGGCDRHDCWKGVDAVTMEASWDKSISDAAVSIGNTTGIPNGLRRYLKDISRSPRNNWRQILHDFIQHDRFDYTFTVPDRRYSGDIVLPSFQTDENSASVKNLWFLIDTSASVSDDAVSEAYAEIVDAAKQIDSISGFLSFFDADVSNPVPFESVDDLLKIKPIGGGGTSFYAIFRYLEENLSDEPPCAIIIITDGYAVFPNESAAMGIPVIWLIVDSDVTPPWGEAIYITTT